MRPEVKRYRPFAFLLNSVDRLGRTIDPTVLSVATEIAPRALLYAEKLLGDPALAMNLFEEAAATVSHALKEKSASGSPKRPRHARLSLSGPFCGALAEKEGRKSSLNHQRMQVPPHPRPIAKAMIQTCVS